MRSIIRKLKGWLVWLHARLGLPRPAPFFSASWYKQQYPDVEASGMDPWRHFHLHGRHEGRFAAQDHVDLWFDEALFERVRADFPRLESSLEPLDKEYLRWLFARWYAARGRWPEVIRMLQSRDFAADSAKPSPFRHLPALLEADALLRRGRTEQAAERLAWLEACYPENTDVALLRANYLRATLGAEEGSACWLEHVNRVYARYGLLPIGLKAGGGLEFDALVASPGPPVNGPLVSVLMAAYNAGATVETALSGLLAQTYRNLEVIVVDDASEDETAWVVQAVVARDDRVRLLRSAARGGPYAARNYALNAARGGFITVHDADDWSHPQKVEQQMGLLQRNSELKGCFSNWVRVMPDLVFGGWDSPPSWLGWVHRNTSSLLFRRSVFEALGYWDEVRCSCDLEYAERIRAAWGDASLDYALPCVPLALGRVEMKSITRLPETHLITALKGLRHDYDRAYARWHVEAVGVEDLYMPQSPRERPFAVSEAMIPGRTQSSQADQY